MIHTMTWRSIDGEPVSAEALRLWLAGAPKTAFLETVALIDDGWFLQVSWYETE